MGVVSVNQILVALAFITLISEASSNGVVELHEDSWYQVTEGEWMIKFYAPWCPACRSLTNSWSDFAEWTQDLGLDGVAEVDVTRNPGLSGRFLVTALPTIFHVKDGIFRQYRGARDKDSFISFIEEKKWTEVDIVPYWKDPRSSQMALVACFFKVLYTLTVTCVQTGKTLTTFLVNLYNLSQIQRSQWFLCLHGLCTNF